MSNILGIENKAIQVSTARLLLSQIMIIRMKLMDLSMILEFLSALDELKAIKCIRQNVHSCWIVAKEK